jgi:hypothetical protein
MKDRPNQLVASGIAQTGPVVRHDRWGEEAIFPRREKHLSKDHGERTVLLDRFSRVVTMTYWIYRWLACLSRIRLAQSAQRTNRPTKMGHFRWPVAGPVLPVFAQTGPQKSAQNAGFLGLWAGWAGGTWG